MDKESFVQRFRESFRKKFFIDVTGVIITFLFLGSSVFFIPFLSAFFDIGQFYIIIILQSAQMIFLMYLWIEIIRLRKDLS